MRYHRSTRYPQGGGLTVERQQFREELRLKAAERSAQGESNSLIAKDLRVGVRSVQRWRQMWDEGGPRALQSQGLASLPRLSEKQFAQLEAEPAKGPAAHGWEDQRWTLARIKTVIGRRFSWRDYRDLLTAAHQQLGGPIVLVWDNLNVHKAADLRKFAEARDWLTIYCLPPYAPDRRPAKAASRARLILPVLEPRSRGQSTGNRHVSARLAPRPGQHLLGEHDAQRVRRRRPD
ncbi:transposase [Streptomyces sp. Amel2xE9]|uniref:transposase n=1 Tax=Streptomyces sp. Amel2xE9 TaxID=1157634 RepID=UPI003B638264